MLSISNDQNVCIVVAKLKTHVNIFICNVTGDRKHFTGLNFIETYFSEIEGVKTWTFIAFIFFWTFYRLQRSWGKVMSLHVSVILSTGEGLPQCMLGYTPPPPPRPRSDPRTRHPPRSRHPQEQTPRSSACWEIWATSGRYASY